MRNVELIMVTAENNNKFYKMAESSDGLEFTITYGRVGQSGVSETYPISKWNSKYKEKIKKGYQDVTHLRTKGVEGSIIFEDLDVETFYKTFTQYSKKTVSSQYNGSVLAEGWDRFYMGDDFTFTMYIDAVNQEFAPTSRSDQRVSFEGLSLLEYFNTYKNISNG